jgi:uracil-DNA glycosylase family 4
MKAQEGLDTLAHQISICTKCDLSKGRTYAVPGEGPAHAEIMLIGEGPGANEDKQGRPFVGASGKFLDQLLAQAGVTRTDVWITNVVKCRPPGNRDPQVIEIEACTTNYLDNQIKIVNPSIIVTLGRHSMGRFIPNAKITQIHGQMQKIGKRFIIPMFHPAAALHQGQFRPMLLEDFAKLPALLEEARQALGKTKTKKTARKNDLTPYPLF